MPKLYQIKHFKSLIESQDIEYKKLAFEYASENNFENIHYFFPNMLSISTTTSPVSILKLVTW